MFELLLGRDNNPLATGLGAVPVFALGDQQAEALKPAVLGLAGGVMAVAAVAGLLMPAQAGASVEPAPFHPVIRGKLITGDESLNLQADIAGGGGEGVSSLDYLWWPPQKIAGKYLTAELGGAHAPIAWAASRAWNRSRGLAGHKLAP